MSASPPYLPGFSSFPIVLQLWMLACVHSFIVTIISMNTRSRMLNNLAHPTQPPYHPLTCAIIANLLITHRLSPPTTLYEHCFTQSRSPAHPFTTLTSAIHYAFTSSPTCQTHLLRCMGQAGEGEAHQVGGVCRVAGLPEEGAGPGGAAPPAPGDCPGPVGHVPCLRGQAPARPAGQV